MSPDKKEPETLQPRSGIRIAMVETNLFGIELRPGIVNLDYPWYGVRLYVESQEEPVFFGAYNVYDDPRPMWGIRQAFLDFLRLRDFSRFTPEQKEMLTIYFDEVVRKVPVEQRTYLLDDPQIDQEKLIEREETWNFILIKRKKTNPERHLRSV